MGSTGLLAHGSGIIRLSDGALMQMVESYTDVVAATNEFVVYWDDCGPDPSAQDRHFLAVHRWRGQELKEHRRIKVDPIFCCFAARGRLLLGRVDNTARLVDLDAGDFLWTAVGELFMSVALGHDAAYWAGTRSVHKLSLKDGSQLAQSKVFPVNSRIDSLHLHDGKKQLVCTQYMAHRISLLDADSLAVLCTVDNAPCFFLHAGHSVLVTADRLDTALRIRDRQTMQLLCTVELAATHWLGAIDPFYLVRGDLLLDFTTGLDA